MQGYKKNLVENAKDLNSIINDLISDSKLNENLKKYSIFNHWKDIVGVDIAKKSKPVKLYDNVLYVKAASPIWANELNLLSRQILKKINDFIGEELIVNLKFKV